MANRHRVIRKVAPQRPQTFDDQMWPVYLSIVLFGGFLAGVILSYLRPDDPRWYANAWTALLALPVLIGSLIILLTYIDNRRQIRRAMQLAIMLSIIANVVLIVSLDREIFSRISLSTSEVSKSVQRREVVIPEYHPRQMNPSERQLDLERPVETESPQQAPTELARQESSEEQSEPQPTMVPEVQATPAPNVVQRKSPDEATPRHSEEPSQLSRRLIARAPGTSQPVADSPRTTPSAATPQRVAAAKAPSQPAPAQPGGTPARRPNPPTDRSQPPQLTRRMPEQQPAASAESVADARAATLPRRLADPAMTPRTQVQTKADPAVAQETAPDALKPANTQARHQSTAGPQVAMEATPPAQEIPTEVNRREQRREAPTEPRSTVAEAPRSIPNQRSRVTNRPEISETASAAARPVLDARDEPRPAASAANLRRQETPATAQPTAQAPAPEVARSERAEFARRATQTEPAATEASAGAQAPPSRIARRAATPAPSVRNPDDPGNAVAVTRRTEVAEIGPSSTATRKQETANDQVAMSLGEPTPATTSRAINAAEVAASRRRSPDVPMSEPAIGTNNRRTNASQPQPNVTTNVAEVATNAAPNTSAEPQPRPSSATVTRQTTDPDPTAQTAQPALETAAASPTTQVAGVRSPRAPSANMPTLNPWADATASPARATVKSAVEASPAVIESPALAQSAEQAGRPAPTQTAIAKGTSGIAGAGEALNLDRAAPAGSGPAEVASGSSQRAQAIQESPRGADLLPAVAVRVPRSEAGAQSPSSTFTAEPVDRANAGGLDRPADVTASSAATVARSDSNAERGPTTAMNGTVDVDLGPTRVVDEGGSSRAAGGGQPDLNFTTPAPQLARNRAGGSKSMALAVAETADVPEAPAGNGGGSPPTVTADAEAAAVVRTEQGGREPIAGGPSTAQERGLAAAESTAALVANTALSRADQVEASAAGAASAAGLSGVDEGEERARILARQNSGGAPQVAMTAETVDDVPATAAEADGGEGSAPDGLAASTGASALPRAAESGGAAVTARGVVDGAGTAPPSDAEGNVGAANMRRAEAAEALPGNVLVGGGTGSPARTATGPDYAANVQAESVHVAGDKTSSGADAGADLAVQGIAPASLGGGKLGPVSTAPVGANEGAEISEGPGSATAGFAGKRANLQAATAGPATGPNSSGALTKSVAESALPVGDTAEIPEGAAAGAPFDEDAVPSAGDLASDMSLAPMARPTGGSAVPVDIEAPDGPGGLGEQYALNAGVADRRSRDDSPEVHSRPIRFARQDVGGLSGFNPSAVVATVPFERRARRDKGDEGSGGESGIGTKTEEAIEAGLVFLARHQAPDGRWTLQGFDEEVAFQSDTAATGLAVLAFQGAAYTHLDGKHAGAVRGGLDFLLKNQQPDGNLYIRMDEQSDSSAWFYSHSIAAMALCEAYGMTQDPQLKEPAQKAIRFIVESQNKERGGWRYSPQIGSDTSVTGWMLMALYSARLANLEVQPDTWKRIEKWLDSAQASDSEPHLYRYNPNAPNTPQQGHGRRPTKTMTAVGLLMRFYTGWRRDNEHMLAGADYLQEHLPSIGTQRDPQRDTYYWYYATQVMFHVGGKHWKTWNERLHPLLVNSQVKEGPLTGSWDPRLPVPDRWAPQAGRIYVTSMNLLSLEVYWRHLPIYDDYAK